MTWDQKIIRAKWGCWSSPSPTCACDSPSVGFVRVRIPSDQRKAETEISQHSSCGASTYAHSQLRPFRLTSDE
jgi:hypothetical protein